MLFEDFKSDVNIALGGNLVSVELEDVDYQYALNRAIRKFKQYGHNTYRKTFMSVEVSKGVSTYSIPSNIEDGIKVIRPNSSGMFSGEDIFVKKAIDELITTKSTSGSCTGVQFLEYEMTLHTLEKYKRYSAFDVDFQIDKFKHEITFFNTPKIDGEIWIVECYENLTDEEYAEIDWVFRWAITEAKLILGSAYRKFSNLPSPDGSTSLPGSEIVQEAKEEQRLLMEEIDNLVDGSIDYYGVYIG
jgi:hypothetical protein